MKNLFKLNPLSRTLLLGGALTSFCFNASCGGSIGGPFSAIYVYVATGTNVAQYAVTISGQLQAMTPATAPATHAIAVATHPAATFAYAVNKADDTIAQYAIGATGLLTALTPATVATGDAPSSATVTADGKFLYAANGDGTISQYSIGATGLLTPLAPATVADPLDGQTIVSTPDSKYVYVQHGAGGTITAYSISANGQLVALAVPSYSVSAGPGTYISPNGKFLYSPAGNAGVSQFSIGTDGALNALVPGAVAGAGTGNDAFGMTPDHKFAYLGAFNGGIAGSPVAQYSVATTGALTPLTPASVAAGNAPLSLIVDPSGKFVYVANGNDGTISEFSIGEDGTLAALTPATVNPAGALHMAYATR